MGQTSTFTTFTTMINTDFNHCTPLRNCTTYPSFLTLHIKCAQPAIWSCSGGVHEIFSGTHAWIVWFHFHPWVKLLISITWFATCTKCTIDRSNFIDRGCKKFGDALELREIYNPPRVLGEHERIALKWLKAPWTSFACEIRLSPFARSWLLTFK